MFTDAIYLLQHQDDHVHWRGRDYPWDPKVLLRKCTWRRLLRKSFLKEAWFKKHIIISCIIGFKFHIIENLIVKSLIVPLLEKDRRVRIHQGTFHRSSFCSRCGWEEWGYIYRLPDRTTEHIKVSIAVFNIWIIYKLAFYQKLR